MAARWFRVYEKKRGDRRTGSPVLGMLGEVVFHGAVFLLGCLGLALILVGFVIPDWRVNRDFVETECTVLDSGVAKTEKNGVVLYRPTIRIRYEVAGETKVTTAYEIPERFTEDPKQSETLAKQFVKGKTRRCWYDPAHPDVVVLVRGYHWGFWLLIVVPIALIVLGGGGLVYGVVRWRTSAERRALLAQQAKSLPRGEIGTESSSDWPGIPPIPDPNESPGTTLAYRLPMFSERGWALVASFVICVLWNGVVLIFVILTLGRHLQGDHDWWATAFIIPFVAVGVGTIYWFFRQLMLATVIGPTIVEVSEHPLTPGRTYELVVSQAGRLKMKFLEVLFVCEEEAIYRQGTTARRETQRVYQNRLFRQEDFTISAEGVFQARCTLAAPPGTMHSFASPHNKIQWKIVVRGEAYGWPPYIRTFPLILLPPSPEGNLPCPPNHT